MSSQRLWRLWRGKPVSGFGVIEETVSGGIRFVPLKNGLSGRLHRLIHQIKIYGFGMKNQPNR